MQMDSDQKLVEKKGNCSKKKWASESNNNYDQSSITCAICSLRKTIYNPANGNATLQCMFASWYIQGVRFKTLSF